MGYYGLGTGCSNKVNDQLTPLEQALRRITHAQSSLALRILDKLLRNIVQNPCDMKFRKLRLTGTGVKKPIMNAILSIEGALSALIELGFVVEQAADSENPQDLDLVLPLSVKLDFPNHVVKVIDAQDYFRKEEEKERARKGFSRVVDPTKEAVEYVESRGDDEILKATAANVGRLGVRN